MVVLHFLDNLPGKGMVYPGCGWRDGRPVPYEGLRRAVEGIGPYDGKTWRVGLGKRIGKPSPFQRRVTAFLHLVLAAEGDLEYNKGNPA